MTFYKASFTDKIIQVNQMQTSDGYELDMIITACLCLLDLENHTVVFSHLGGFSSGFTVSISIQKY